mmetsp:Transcript_71409/g.165133  ORF Transcript_71409/g.165133 Transcript_71409/m.165133 type:complete len:911 (+) Transcript_71409:67-2799(+)
MAAQLVCRRLAGALLLVLLSVQPADAARANYVRGRSAAAAPPTKGVTPVDKVIELLTKLRTQVEADGKKEAAQYDKYACFCKEQADEKLYAIEKSTKLISDLEAEITALAADIAALGTSIGEKETRIFDLEDQISAAASARDTEHKAYLDKEADIKAAISAVERAIAALKDSKGMLSGKVALEADSPTGGALMQVVSVLQKHMRQPGEAYEYVYHSNDIIATLEGLLATFKETKERLYLEEFEANSAFEKDKLAKENEKGFAAKEKLEMEKLEAAKTERKQAAEAEKSEEEKDKTSDQDFMRTLKDSCETKAAEWDKRSKTRAAELVAINQAMEALTTGVVPNWAANRKLVGLQKGQEVKRPPAFIQLGGGHHAEAKVPHKVLDLLQKAAQSLSSPVLSAAVLRVKASEDHFVKVRSIIKDIIQRLKAQAAAEATTKSFCDSQMEAAVSTRDAKQEEVESLTATITEKEALKKKTIGEAAWFAYALINGVREKLGSFKLEPPQLFRGRGEHPKQGLLKKRTFPESVVINIAEDACVPKLVGMPGHAYKDVVHENTVQWIASFEDGLLGETKYVSFAATSGLKGQPDMLKYDRARRLLACIGNVRQSYEKLQTSKSIVERQKATATYFIDKLALRVGGEKNTEEEADTVGCCSLRVEHLKLEPPNTIHFDFLGKDSIRYQNSVQVTDQVYENVSSFMNNKTPDQDVFDKVQPTLLNDYFKEFMEDLTAKVFRTFNASFTLQQELAKFDVSKKNSYTQEELVKFYNNANRQVAILCNHQRAESKQHGQAMQRMEEIKNTMEKNIRILKKHLLALQAGKSPKNSESKLPKDVVSCKKKIAETRMRLDKHATAMAMKEENKTVSLTTSKVNYMDPRITVAWCKKVDLAIEKVFPRTVRTKFPWAMHFKSSYQFD